MILLKYYNRISIINTIKLIMDYFIYTNLKNTRSWNIRFYVKCMIIIINFGQIIRLLLNLNGITIVLFIGI
jgi:hypothetical protein